MTGKPATRRLRPGAIFAVGSAHVHRRQTRQLAQILRETAGQPREVWLERVEQEIPRAPNAANILLALHTLIELDKLDINNAEAIKQATENLLHALERAEALSGTPDMTVAEAKEYLSEVALGGNVEAQKLLKAFYDPFAYIG